MKLIKIIGLFILFAFLASDLNAQCAMCKAVAEDSADLNAGIGRGINNAILYIMAVPYVLMLLCFIAFLRKKPSFISRKFIQNL